MNEPLIHAQIMNPVMPSIPSMLDEILNTITQTTIFEFDLPIDDLCNTIDSSEKDDTVKYVNTTTLHHIRKIVIL